MATLRAFLVGVADYHQSIPSLPFVPEDLDHLATALRAAGYHVTVHLGHSPSLNTIRQAVSEFIAKGKIGDTSLIYLSGHGVHHKAIDYLLPGDVRIDVDHQPESNFVAVNCWDAQIGASLNANVVVFVDACREGVSYGRKSAVASWSKGKVRTYRSKRVAYVFACGPGQLAYYVNDERGSFSLFARALVQAVAAKDGPISLRGLTDAANATLETLVRDFGKGEQRVQIRAGVQELDSRELVLFPGAGRKDPDRDLRLVPAPRPWWKSPPVWVLPAIAATVMATAAPAVPKAAPACCPPPAPVHLVLESWGDLDSDVFGHNSLIEEYQRLNPHVTIEQRLVRTLPEHAENVQKGLRNGFGLGDVVAAEESIMGDMYVRPLDWVDLRPLVGDLSRQYIAFRWESGQTPDGKRLLGLPTDIQSVAICYRRDLFQQAGLPSDRDAVGKLWPGWGDFLNMGRQYIQRTGKPLLDNVQQVFVAMALQGGEPLFVDRDNVFKADASQGLKGAWDKAVAMRDISAGLPTYSPDWDASFTGTAFAATVCPNWILGHIEAKSGAGFRGKWDIATVPGGGGGHWGGSWLSVPVQSKHQAEAAKLIAFLTSRRGQLAAFAKQPGLFPAHVDAIASPEVQGYKNAFFNDAPTGKIYTAAAQATMPVYLGCRYSTIMEKAMVNALREVENRGLEPPVGWEKAIGDARRFKC
jgi:cellobiose transport system substrate-binding protein